MKKILIFVFIFIISIILVMFFILKDIGYIEYIKNGSSYFIRNDNYHHSTTLSNEEYSMTINMNNLEDYSNKIVIENELFKVRMSSIKIEEDSNITLYFYIESNYTFNGGKIVYIGDLSNNAFWNNKLFSITTDIEGVTNLTRVTGEGPYLKDGYGVGIYINFDQDVDLSKYENITFTFKNFIINNYDKK